MRRLLLYVVLIGIIFHPLAMLAESADSTHTLLTDGARALEFGLRGLINFERFEGSTISLKKYNKRGKVYRIGLSFSARKNDLEGNQNYRSEFMDIDSTFEYNKETIDDYWSSSISIYTQYLHYFNPQDKFQSYLGVGPIIGYYQYYDHDKSWRDEDLYTGNNEVVYKQKNYHAGLMASAGVEWFCRRNISLIVEYNSKFIFTKQEDTTTYTRIRNTSIDDSTEYYTQTDKTENKRDNYSYSPYIKFGLAIRF